MKFDIKALLNKIPDHRFSRAMYDVFKRILPNGNDTALTAHAGGGQANALKLNKDASFHEVTTVATAGDSVALPPALVGEKHTVKNSGANKMQVYGQGTDTIDSVAYGTGVPLNPGEEATYVCLVSGNYLRSDSVNGLTATSAQINRACDPTTRIVATTATALAITAVSHGSKVVLVNSTAPAAITLPAATGSGEKYTFVIGVDATATGHTIKVANTADAITGVSVLATTDTAQVTGFATTATDDTITLNGTTKGGAMGDRIEIIDVATAKFQVSIVGRATGTVATPFSATV